MQWFTQQNGLFGADIVEFTQEAEDLVLLPNFWSHATLNLEASIGYAFEFEYTPWLSKINPDLFNRQFQKRDQKLYDGWYIPPEYGALLACRCSLSLLSLLPSLPLLPLLPLVPWLPLLPLLPLLAAR